MYKNLKFSWAHILLFLAVIYIGYVTYVGLSYKMDEGLTKPLFFTLLILAILLFWFVGVQQLKGVDNDFNFSRCIWGERFLLFTSPFLFFLCMIPFNHAWNVSNYSEEIETKFRSAIKSSTKMFDDYDTYAQNRIANYKAFLQRVKANKSIQPTVYNKVGFTGKNDDHKIDIEVETLNLQLTAKYDSLSTNARSWISRADQSTSVWNVFLVGNIKEIKTAINEWSSQLNDFSSVILTTESYGSDKKVIPFNANANEIQSTLNNLDSLSAIYTSDDKLSLKALIIGILLYLMMISPYFVQKRNGVNTYTLLGRRFINGGIDISTTKTNTSTNAPEIGVIMDLDINKDTKNKTEQQEIEMEPVLEEDTDEEINRSERHRRRRERRLNREQTSTKNDLYEEDDEIITTIEDIQ